MVSSRSLGQALEHVRLDDLANPAVPPDVAMQVSAPSRAFCAFRNSCVWAAVEGATSAHFCGSESGWEGGSWDLFVLRGVW